MNPIPTSPVQANWRYILPICLVATLGGLLFGYDTGVISGAIEPLTARFNLSDFMKGWASGCALVGCAAGVLLVGPLSDRFGRRLAMFLAAAMFLISAIGTALPNDITTFIIFPHHRRLGHRHRFGFNADVHRGNHPGPHPRPDGGGEPNRDRRRHRADSFFNYFIAQQGDQAWLIDSGCAGCSGRACCRPCYSAAAHSDSRKPALAARAGQAGEARRILEKVGGATFAGGECASIEAALAQERGTWGELFSTKLRLR